MGWELALPSWVELGPSFTKAVGPSLVMGSSPFLLGDGGWPFLLGVAVGPSFSGWELPFGIAVGVGILPRGWPFLSWVGVGPFLQEAGAPFRRGGKSSLWR